MFKKIFLLLFLICASLSVLIFSCDEVEAPYTVDTGITGGNTSCTFPTITPPVFRKVLVEDYTGHLCGYCPDAGRTIYAAGGLKDLYGDTVISVGVHASPGHTFTETCPPHSYPSGAAAFAPVYTEDFRTPAGETWLTDFGVVSNPKGLISRTTYAGNVPQNFTSWNSAVQAVIDTPMADAAVQIVNSYNNATGELNICVKTTFLSSLSSDYKLSVMLAEDSVKAWQVDYDIVPPVAPLYQNDTNYYHRHVFRGAINSTYGEAIKTGGAVAGDTAVKSYLVNLLSLPAAVNPLNPTLDISHCYIIAFVYDANTKEILQVEEAHVQ
jgi:hypothetical protein